jgi:hypothetical protein
MNALTQTLLALILALASLEVFAHGGGLDSKGCHTNRKTGEYHCHRAQPRTQPESNAFLSQSSSATPRAFRNCAEARAAGAAPVLRGQPGYGPHLDRDNDGVGCE